MYNKINNNNDIADIHVFISYGFSTEKRAHFSKVRGNKLERAAVGFPNMRNEHVMSHVVSATLFFVVTMLYL